MHYWRDGFLKGIAYWIYDFQVLIGAILASIAALVTIYYIRKQISQSSKHREDELESAKIAAKIEAVWALRCISEYDDECLSYITVSNTQKNTYKHVEGALGRSPEIDYSVVSILSKLAANSEPVISSKIQNYLAHLQIQNSRLKSLRDSLAGRSKMPDGTTVHEPHVLAQALLDHYVLKFQTNRLLGYCRGDFEDVRNLMSKVEVMKEITNFPDVSFLNSNMIDHISLLWPEQGWWTVK